MKRWPKEAADYIEQNIAGTTTKEMTQRLNDLFADKYGFTFTETKVKGYKKNHNLKSGTKCGNPKGFSPKYPDGMLQYIESIADGKTSEELAQAVNEKYGAGTINARQMQAYKKNHGITTGVVTRFEPGHEPPNKGKKMSPEQYERCKATMFKKGDVSANHMDVGEYSHTTDGYLIRKKQEHGTQRERWEFVGRAVWEEHYGPVPEGKMVTYLDGNKDNCDIDNLALIDNEINLTMNRRKLRKTEKELTRIGVKVAELEVATRKAKKRRKEA